MAVPLPVRRIVGRPGLWVTYHGEIMRPLNVFLYVGAWRVRCWVCQRAVSSDIAEWEGGWPTRHDAFTAAHVHWDLAHTADPMPVFPVKGKDALAAKTLKFYRALCLEAGLSYQAEQVALAIDEVVDWQRRNRDLIGLPTHEHAPASAHTTGTPVDQAYKDGYDTGRMHAGGTNPTSQEK